MKHVSFPATDIATATIVPFPGKKPKGFLASILDALHYSRHMQARRVLGHYRHLIDRSVSDPRPGAEDERASFTD